MSLKLFSVGLDLSLFGLLMFTQKEDFFTVYAEFL